MPSFNIFLLLKPLELVYSNKIVIKCGCVHSGLLLSGDNKQLRGKQIGDDHDRKKENNSGGCGEADRYLP